MAHYVHHVPGRLRIKSVHLKRNEARAARVRDWLAETPGVLAAETNTVTGSLLISYARDQTCPHELLQRLKREGCCADSAQLPGAGRSASNRVADSLSGAGGAVGKAVVALLVEKVVERSAVALVGAVL